MDESHSDINEAFGPHRSVSSQWGDNHLLSSLIDIKNDLSTEVRALTKRMSHIDDQISQIFHFLSPINNTSVKNITAPVERISPSPQPLPSQIPSPPSAPLSPVETAMSPEANDSSVSMSPLFETASFYSNVNAKMTLFEANQSLITTTTTTKDVHDLPRQSRTNEQTITTPPIRQITGHDATILPIPPPSVYNRSASSSISSLGASTTSRNSVSNKIAPAPVPPAPVSPKHSLTTTFQPISNTRFNPGRSPKPKARSQHVRTTSKLQQQYPEKSTIIELEPSGQEDIPSKSVPLLGTASKTASTTKSSGSVFRRLITGGNSSEKTTVPSSSTLLYPPTSDDERPISPASSGNEDDDYRPLTSSSKYHHQTPL